MSRQFTKQNPPGVPEDFTKVTASSRTFILQKGQLNKLRLRPQIQNEHAESSRNIIGEVDATTIVGQVFKASQDNINGLNLAMESAGGVEFDDFESYADSTALQVEWVESVGDPAELNTSNQYAGDKCMVVDAGEGFTGAEWKRDFATTDFVGYTGQFWMYCNKEYKDVQMRVFVEDSTGDTSSSPILTVDKDAYYKYIFPTASLTEDVVGNPADLTDIIAIGFRVEKEKRDGLVYFDELVSVPGPGSVELKLWDMGTSIPVSTTTSIDDGTQYIKLGDAGISGIQAASVSVDLLGGFRTYHIDKFVAGVALEIPTNELLTTDHYYAITINYVDTDVSVYGPNSAWDNYYTNGYSFTAPDEATAITATGADEDLMFVIYSVQDVYISAFQQFADATPNGNSQTIIYLEDSNMKRVDTIMSGSKGRESALESFPRPYFLEKGGKLEQEQNDDFTDSVSEITVTFQYYHEPNTPHE